MVPKVSKFLLQNVESCSHNLKRDCKMLKVAVIIRNVTATFTIVQSDFEISNQMIPTFEM